MNVTPLVDVVLVLLIIFMVVLPAMNSELNVELAPIQNPDDEKKTPQDPIVLSIDRQGKYYIDEFQVRDGELQTQLASAHAAAPLKRLVVRGDRGLHYEKVRDLMAAVQGVGFPGVSLRVSKTALDDAQALAKSVRSGQR